MPLIRDTNYFHTCRPIYLHVQKFLLNPLSPTSDLDRLSPYTIVQYQTKKVMRLKKNTN